MSIVDYIKKENPDLLKSRMMSPRRDVSILDLPTFVYFIFVIFLLCSYALYQRHLRIRAFRSFALQNECTEIPKRRQQWWKFGADAIYESWRWKKRHSYLELLQKNFDEYGKTYSSKVLGVNKITTIDPANVEAVLKTKWEDFIARPARIVPLDGLVGPGVLTADGPLWKQHRKLMMPSFSRKALEDLTIYDEHFERFMQHVPRDGRVFDLQDLYFRLTLDSSTAHLLGCSSNTLASSSELSPEPELAGAFDRAQRAAVDHADPKQAITNTFLDLFHSPDAQEFTKELRKECDTILAGHNGEWTKAALNDLVLVDSAIKESMRLSVRVIGMHRIVTAPNGVDFDGCHVPRGVRVAVPNHFIQRDPDIYHEAERYNAFRYAAPAGVDKAELYLKQKQNSLSMPSDSFLAWGHGRHACPGRFFATHLMKIMLAHVLVTYDVEAKGPKPNGIARNEFPIPSLTATFDVKLRK